MINNKITSFVAVLALASVASCTSMDELEPQGGSMLASQYEATVAAVPQRADAVFTGMYTKLGDPLSYGNFSPDRPDDFGFIMMAFSNDLEASDIAMPNIGYNWFSACGDLTSRNADYANPYIRYRGVYDEVARAHDVMNAYGDVTEETSADVRARVGQAYAIRAFCYLNIAPYFQFRYAEHQEDPCVPIVTRETVDVANNPRATVKEVYDLILSDLTTAIEYLEGYQRPDKSKIDQQVAYGLRARAYLNMEKWEEAAEDAAKAAAGYTPSSIADCSKPSFCKITEPNWLWGYDMTPDVAKTYPYATSSAWIRSFSADGYSPATQCYAFINNLLYNKIPDTDVRKGWWVNEDLYSPLLEGLTFPNPDGGVLVGQEIATANIADVKATFLPYTNVKFACDPIGTTLNDEDWPFMRVEEMLLIQAEALYKSGKTAEGIKVLNDFVKTYRDPAYNAELTGRKFEDEVWFQRRVELWGEGFANNDTRRLGKPFVRFHDNNSNIPDAFRFNVAADDRWLLMRFCTTELNFNEGIEDNEGGNLPVMGQNKALRDGVTD